MDAEQLGVKWPRKSGGDGGARGWLRQSKALQLIVSNTVCSLNEMGPCGMTERTYFMSLVFSKDLLGFGVCSESRPQGSEVHTGLWLLSLRLGHLSQAAPWGSGILCASPFKFLSSPGPGPGVCPTVDSELVALDGRGAQDFPWLSPPCSPGLENIPQAGQGRLWVKFLGRDSTETHLTPPRTWL